MAVYFVSGSGSNTAPYDTWAKAATLIQTALTAANADGDIVAIDVADVPSADKEAAGNTTYGCVADVFVVASTNSGTSTVTPSVMGTSMWIGSSTASRSPGFSAGGFSVRTYGLTFRTGATSNCTIAIAAGDSSQIIHDDLYVWLGTTNASAGVIAASQDQQIFCELINPTFRFGSTGQRIRVAAKLKIVGGSVSSAGSAPNTGMFTIANTDPGGAEIEWVGGDLSHLGSGAVVAESGVIASTVRLAQCKLGSSYTLLTGAGTNLSGTDVFASDCASGDVHGLMHHENALGSTVSDQGIYYTSGAAGQSWKITTTANTTYAGPYVSPWIDWFAPTGSAITPRLEILRDGSSTAYTDAQVWMQSMTKDQSGSVLSTFRTGRQSIADYAAGTAGANLSAGAGLGSWTGESGTAWSGKIDAGSVTPAEVGYMRARVCVGVASSTVYVDPQIRT